MESVAKAGVLLLSDMQRLGQMIPENESRAWFSYLEKQIHTHTKQPLLVFFFLIISIGTTAIKKCWIYKKPQSSNIS